MSVWRVDRPSTKPSEPANEVEWFTCEEAAVNRAKWLTEHGTRQLVVWEDLATYWPIPETASKTDSEPDPQPFATWRQRLIGRLDGREGAA